MKFPSLHTLHFRVRFDKNANLPCRTNPLKCGMSLNFRLRGRAAVRSVGPLGVGQVNMRKRGRTMKAEPPLRIVTCDGISDAAEIEREKKVIRKRQLRCDAMQCECGALLNCAIERGSLFVRSSKTALLPPPQSSIGRPSVCFVSECGTSLDFKRFHGDISSGPFTSPCGFQC